MSGKKKITVIIAGLTLATTYLVGYRPYKQRQEWREFEEEARYLYNKRHKTGKNDEDLQQHKN